MKSRAFTLLEILIVLALIIMIAGLGVASWRRAYERSKFQSAVVALQVDLNRTRLLAMRSGQAYLFRCIPGAGIYEIAPLHTLQETIYRINGESEDELDSAGGLGGSLSYDYSSFSDPTGAIMGTPGQYTDDLFSDANIRADLNSAQRLRRGAGAIQETSPLGGSLAASAYGTTPGTDLAAMTSGAEFALDPSLAGTLTEPQSITLRPMNRDERTVGEDVQTVAWRVNGDGLVVRKEAAGDLIFTFSRISLSTPGQLRSKRPGAAENSNSPTTSADPAGGEDLGSRLGGSLHSIPTGGEGGSELGGGLGVAPGDVQQALYDAITPEETGYVSLWTDPILFYPNGKTSTAVVGLASSGKYRFYSEIAIRGMTGYARISGISVSPPGSELNPTSLTQEQLFRLTHPEDYAFATSGDASQTDATGGALGATSTLTPEQALDPASQDPLGVGIGDDLLNPGGAENADGAGNGFAPAYGSRDRRSGYRFDSSPAQNRSGAQNAELDPFAAVSSATSSQGTSGANGAATGTTTGNAARGNNTSGSAVGAADAGTPGLAPEATAAPTASPGTGSGETKDEDARQSSGGGS